VFVCSVLSPATMATGRGYGSVNKHVALAHGVSYVIQYFVFVFCISPHFLCCLSLYIRSCPHLC